CVACRVCLATGAVSERAAWSAEEDGLTIVLTSAGRYDRERFDESVVQLEERVDFFRDKGLLDVEHATVKRRGHDVVVRLSGVKHAARAQRVVVPPPLYFRPVLARVPVAPATASDDPA